MKKSIIKPLVVFIVCVIAVFLFNGLAAHVRNDFGNVEVTTGFLTPENSRIAYRLYKPKSATAANPAAAVLAMHGYQSDKDTNAAFCIELARRGIVVLSIDSYGHGDSSPGMRGRGWANYNIKNLDKTISGPKRFMVMMTFSILDFFRPKISEGLIDSSMGGRDAWQHLSSLSFVDSSRMGLTGHSMGTWSSWSVASSFPEHRAIVLQCGEVFPLSHYDSENIKFNNVLLLQALIEEFENMRDYQQRILGLETTPLRYSDFMGQEAPVEWNKTYGSFEDGTARRMELVGTNHRLVTYDSDALTPAMNWFITALDVETAVADTSHVQWLKECLNFLAMLAAMVSMLPLFLVLVKFKFFESLALPLKSEPKMLSPKSRANTVLIAIIVSGVTFPFMTQLGHGLLPLPESIFRMTIGNGFITWLGFLMIVAVLTLYRWYKKGNGKKDGWTLADLGMEGQSHNYKKLIIRSVIAAFILTGTMYILTCLSVVLFQLDFRFIWPFFRPFNLARFGQFLVYLPVYAAFFTINAGVKLYGQLRLPECKTPLSTQLAWWGYSIFVMLGGLFVIALIQYIPFFMGFGPGADLLFSSLFGGPFMSILILLVPQFAVFFFFSTWLYRKSGTVYVGSFVLAILATWVVTGGSAIF
ncbi:MAG: S9 family peptidase [Treponema sp.]|nr:S9 family peptidase [Treponema sp.]